MNFKLSLFPYARTSVELSKSADDIKNSVASKMDHIDNFNEKRMNKMFKDYEGMILKDGFKIRRIPSFGYSFFIIIAHGTIEQKSNTECTINFILSFNKSVNLFLSGAGVFILLLAATSLLFGSTEGFFEVSQFFLLIYLFVTIVFNYETFLFKKHMNDLFI